ncbi:HNH endonuclease signature motif containing protein [Tsukamurella soli]|uniref:HNH nuclease domain-containing protein n=1 Tax=Tsukamurella soli TaxID=644556 RepID=A0ABP8JNH8_9ACTN
MNTDNRDGASGFDYLAALAMFEQATSTLAAADPDLLTPRESLDAMVRLERCVRRLSPVTTAIAATADRLGVPGELGHRNLRQLLVAALRLSGGEAAARVKAVRWRVAETLPTGDVVAPRRPHLAEAQADGAISDTHVAAVEHALERCRKRLTGDESEQLEDILTTLARESTPEAVRKAAKHAADLVDPDGAEPDEQDARRARSMDVRPQDDDGLTDIDGTLDSATRALLDAVLAKWGRPGVCNPADPESVEDAATADEKELAAAVKRDERTATQRRHDALSHALQVALGSAGSHRGVPAVVVATMTIDQLTNLAGTATTATGGTLPVADALRLAGGHPRYLVLTDFAGRPLWLGRSRRLASVDQRIALYATEKGCTAPGCDAPPAFCAVHHMHEYGAGGATDIGNLTLVCDVHHATVTPTGNRTAPVVDGPYAGRTGWSHPRIDDGAVRVNHTHDCAELYRQALERWEATRGSWLRSYAERDMARQEQAAYRDQVGTIHDDIGGILDGDAGAQILEQMLADHDAAAPWDTPASGASGASPASGALEPCRAVPLLRENHSAPVSLVKHAVRRRYAHDRTTEPAAQPPGDP